MCTVKPKKQVRTMYVLEYQLKRIGKEKKAL
jgi:hypothetical protein